MTGIIDKARLDPAAVFETPHELVGRNDLTRVQKIEVLLRWEHDVRGLCVAEEEGMTGELPDYETDPPTKQGGVQSR